MAVSQSLTLTQVSQSVANNTSTVRILWTSTQTGESYNGYTRTAYYYVSVNGGSEVRYSVSYTLPKASTKTIVDTTLTVVHTASGAGSITVRTWMDTDISASEIEQSKSLTLTTIPRATTPTLSAASVYMGSAVTISLPRASSGFTHNLAYSFAGGSYVSIATGVATSYSWTVPDLATSIPKAASGTMTIRCITMSGSTTIGTKTVTMTAMVPASVVPTIGAVSVSEATAGLAAQFGAFIANKSALTVKITASGASGSTIIGYKTTLLGSTYTAASFTTGVLTSSGTLTMSVAVTDSRGRTATKAVSIFVLAYTQPQITNLRAFRCDETGAAAVGGSRLSVTYKYSVPSLNGGNTAAMALSYKRTTDTSYTTLLTGSAISGDKTVVTGAVFSADSSYDLLLTVVDYFGTTATYAAKIPTAEVILDFSASGKAAAFGKVAEKMTGLETAWPLYDSGGLTVRNGLAFYESGGVTDPDTSLEELILTSTNTPDSGFWYIRQAFYSKKAADTNRTQIAVPYDSGATFPRVKLSTYRRNYVSGTGWSDWMEEPAIVETGTSGIWAYTKWSDGRVDLTGVHELNSVDCNTALGTMYRTAVLQPDSFPFTVTDPVLTASYESNGYGAFLWATAVTATTKPPSYYLVRPTSTTIATGKIVMRVTGRWK